MQGGNLIAQPMGIYDHASYNYLIYRSLNHHEVIDATQSTLSLRLP
jgi:hypothetical protein